MSDSRAGFDDGGGPPGAGEPPRPADDDGRRPTTPRPEHIRGQLERFSSEFLLLVSPNLQLTGASTRSGGLILGYEQDEQAGQQVTDFLHPDDVGKVLALTERARRTPGFEENLHVRARHKDGSWRMLDVRVFDAAMRSDLLGVVVRVRDITDEHNARMTASDLDRFSSLAEMLPFGILSADARGWVAYSNEAARQILYLSTQMISGHGWEQAVAPEDWEEVSATASRVVAAGISENVTFRVATSMFQRWAEVRFVPLGSPSEPSGWIATVEDITDRRRAEGELAHLATHDMLTGLPNRALLGDRLERARSRLQRGLSSSLTLLFVDLDRFKEINDTLGHQVGDAVLVEVAHRLRTALREVDTVARFGGDEFVAVCESLPPGEAAELEKRLGAALDQPVVIDGRRVPIGASVGHARTTDVLVQTDQLLARADDSMYRNKQERRAARQP